MNSNTVLTSYQYNAQFKYHYQCVELNQLIELSLTLARLQHNVWITCHAKLAPAVTTNRSGMTLIKRCTNITPINLVLNSLHSITSYQNKNLNPVQLPEWTCTDMTSKRWHEFLDQHHTNGCRATSRVGTRCTSIT